MRRGRFVLLGLGSSITVLALVAVATLATLDSLGARPSGDRQARIERSPNYRDGGFTNLVPTESLEPGGFLPMLEHQFFGDEERVPKKAIPTVARKGSDYTTAPTSDLRTVWMGHSTVLVEIDGARVLVDPIWSERCSPASFFGPERFFPAPLPFAELPTIDAVVISHDHYDHLDMATVQALASRGTPFFVPLGIGAHLEHWGVPQSQITDLDWYEDATVGDLHLTATPARHYSGRSVWQDNTLWSSWVIAGPTHRVYYSGDSGYADHFRAIGERFGPFDLALLKIGASDPTWKQIHMDPEEAVRAAQDLHAAVMQPVHWGTFNLAYHAWNEPAERAWVAAEQSGVRIVFPRPGEWMEPSAPAEVVAWWR
jgi:L-ascorbate metabolism protein UlaG (beta-lactamase superfamily)